MTKTKKLGITFVIILLGIIMYRFMQAMPNLSVIEGSIVVPAESQTPILTTGLTAVPIPETTTAVEQNDNVFAFNYDDHIDTTPPIVLNYLENDTTLRFFCLNSEECYQDIDLLPYIDKISENNSISFDMYYVNPTSVYIVLFNAIEQPIILHFNPETHQVASTILPASSPWWDHYLLSDENLIVLSSIGEKSPTSSTLEHALFVIRPDLSVNQIELDTGCVPDTTMFAGIDGNVILLKVQTLPQGAKYFSEVCIVDTISGEQTQKQIEVPRNAWVYSISPDLEKLYYLYVDTGIKKTGHIFGSFDIVSGEENVIYNDQCINMQGGYQQYNGMLFSETFGLTEGNVKATLIRMDDFSPVICEGENPQLDMIRELKIVPFGDYFLLGSRTQVMLISPDGEVIDQFDLPPALLLGDYEIMEYRR